MTFSYARVGYYLWISETEAISLCKKYNFQHPFHFYNYFRNHEELWDDYMFDFLKNLRNKLVDKTGNKELLEMTNKKFLKQALILNPDRIAAFKSSTSKGKSKFCGNENCCQNKKK
nr:hypothetical protein [uncultured Marinifilum sp.]